MLATTISRKLWSIKGDTGNFYITDTEELTCTCPDWKNRGHLRPCKHLRFLGVNT